MNLSGALRGHLVATPANRDYGRLLSVERPTGRWVFIAEEIEFEK